MSAGLRHTAGAPPLDARVAAEQHLGALARPVGRPRRLWVVATVVAAALAGVFEIGIAPAHRDFLLVNPTPSEPPGLYMRAVDQVPQVGSIVGFMAPSAAFPYADQHASFLRRTPILKAIAAAAGDWVCTAGGVLTINGTSRAPIMVRDTQGRSLPRWSGCRRLGAGELFVLSTRVPNSFDSRYFGPIRTRAARVYLPLLTTNGLGR